MIRLSYCFLLICGLSVGMVSSLECFVCSGEDCNTVSGSTTIVNCEANEPTPPPPTDYDDIQSDSGDILMADTIPLLEDFEEEIEVMEQSVVLDSGLGKSIGGAAFTRRHVTQFSDDNGFRCFTALFEDAGSQQTLRGCARLEDGADETNICTAATSIDIPLVDCQLCAEPLCNAAYRLAPLTTFGAALLITVTHIFTNYGDVRI